MDHGHGGSGGDMPMGPMCAMHMLWNTQIVDTCIVFSAWHVRSTPQFVLSFTVIVALGVLYEYLRVFTRDVDLRIRERVGKRRRALSPSPASDRSTPERQASEDIALIHSRRTRSAAAVAIPPHFRALRAVLYGACVALSAFLMLVFMTYNAYLIFAVVAGAAIGHYLFSSPIGLDDKGMACH